MQLCKLQLASGEIRVGAIDEGDVRFLDLSRFKDLHDLSDVLHAEQPGELAGELIDEDGPRLPLDEVDLLAPVDRQEVWAAGEWSDEWRVASDEERKKTTGQSSLTTRHAPLTSRHAPRATHHSSRPELFFKAPAYRVSGTGERVHIRRDSKWNVPEPELALVLSPQLKLVGFTIGNDMSARAIEGENPLYLPQAKTYDYSCALGPAITLPGDMPPADHVCIRLVIERGSQTVFDRSTSLSAMKRPFDELISWLGREISFPHGAILLTGTGVVPGDDFTLAVQDVIHIDITGIGRLTNYVEQRE